MAGMSNYLENALLNATLTGTTYTSPSTVYLALFTSNPNDDGSGTEVSGASYTRKAVTFGPASGGICTNNAAIIYNQATTAWGTVGWVGVYDAVTGGNLLYHGALASPVVIAINTILTIQMGNLSISLA